MSIDPISLIQQRFEASAKLKLSCVASLAPIIAEVAEKLKTCLQNGNKILVCGNGGSAADAQHLAAELVGRFERERPELACIALTTDTSILTAVANDYAFENIFAKQVKALGQAGDLLIGISTSGNSGNVLQAIQVAQQKGLTVLALTGNTGGKIGAVLSEHDLQICVPHPRTAHIQEVHITIIHCLCEVLDSLLFD